MQSSKNVYLSDHESKEEKSNWERIKHLGANLSQVGYEIGKTMINSSLAY